MKLSWILAAAALTACGTSSAPSKESTSAPSQPGAAAEAKPEAPAEEAPAPAAEQEPFELFGAPLDVSKPEVAFADILANPSAYSGKELVTSGTVRASCTKRGCWMEVRPEEARDGESLTVRFKDYAFFMPLDSRGARVKFQAFLRIVHLTPDQVLETESEGGTIAKKMADGSADVVMMLASGVEMRGRKQKK